MQENSIKYKVLEVVEESLGVVTLNLTCEDGLPEYKAGQFITVFFQETGQVEGKSYSISSSPSSDFLSITVKGVGAFSNKLIAMKVGDIINASLPYGYFYSESEANSMILVAGGIGIAPLMSMIKYSRKVFPVRKIILLFSNKTLEHIIFRNELNELSRQSDGNLVVEYYLTQEVSKMEEKKGRIPVNDIFKCYEGFTDSELFICGSIEFVRDYWRGLKGAGVPVEKIYTEAFF